MLLNKLYRHGIRDGELTWFTNYLTNRSQVVVFQSAVPSPCSISSGVSQGSILGPLLFVLYINDIPDEIIRCNILLYADDAVLFHSSKDETEIYEILNEELSIIYNWILRNRLHTRKTEFLLFGTNARVSHVTDLSDGIGNLRLKPVTEFIYLGAVLDESLTWAAHVKHILTRAGSRVGMLGRLKKHLTTYATDILYRSFIVLVLKYCS